MIKLVIRIAKWKLGTNKRNTPWHSNRTHSIQNLSKNVLIYCSIKANALHKQDAKAIELRAATYGSRRMQIELNAQGFAVERYKVRSLM